MKERTSTESPVEVFDYDPEWPIMFEKERAKILSMIGDKVVAIEHVGSTAVPGLGAKAIVDIMVGVCRLSDAKDCVEPLRNVGYEYIPEYEASIPERRYFRKGPSGVPNQHFHLHMVECNSHFWKRHLLFRDYLRAHPDTALEYYKLKKRLAAKYGSDHESYTEAKTSFIEDIVSKASEGKSMSDRTSGELASDRLKIC